MGVAHKDKVRTTQGFIYFEAVVSCEVQNIFLWSDTAPKHPDE